MMLADGHIFYLEQTLADLPEDTDWLTSAEHLRLASFHVPKRRSDWLLGRWTAKCALSAYFGWARQGLGEIEVGSLASGAPKATIPDGHVPPAISISHSGGIAMCALGPPGTCIGCDIERLEERSQAFIETFFTTEESAAFSILAKSEKKILTNIIWSTKESCLKSIGRGLSLDTRCVVIIPPQQSDLESASKGNTTWFPIEVMNEATPLVAHWRLAGSFVETVTRQDAPILALKNPLPIH